MADRFSSQKSKNFFLNELTETQIREYLEKEGESFYEPLIRDVTHILKNPMILTLYCEAEKWMKINPNPQEYKNISLFPNLDIRLKSFNSEIFKMIMDSAGMIVETLVNTTRLKTLSTQ